MSSSKSIKTTDRVRLQLHVDEDVLIAMRQIRAMQRRSLAYLFDQAAREYVKKVLG